MSSFYLAAKASGEKAIATQSIANLSRQLFTAEDIVKAEGLILKGLE